MKYKEAKKLYEQYLFFLSEADDLAAHKDYSSADTLRDSALDLEREIIEGGFSLDEFE